MGTPTCELNLAEVYLSKTEELLKNGDTTFTWDDFFDEVGIQAGKRSDFAVAAILKQAHKISGTSL